MFRTLKFIFRDFPGPFCFLINYHSAVACLKAYVVGNWFNDVKKGKGLNEKQKAFAVNFMMVKMESGK